MPIVIFRPVAKINQQATILVYYFRDQTIVGNVCALKELTLYIALKYTLLHICLLLKFSIA